MSCMAAWNLFSQGEEAAKVEAELRMRGDQRGLHFTVDHNNFLPCVAVSLHQQGHGTTVDYRPL